MIKKINKQGFTQLEKLINNILTAKVGKITKKLFYWKKKKSGVFLTGFTLVEMLIAVSIFAAVAVASSSLFGTFANNQKKTKVSQELLNNAQYALEIISREVKNNEIITFGSDRNDRCQNLPLAYTQCLLFARENGETAAFVYSGTALYYIQLNCEVDEQGIYSVCAQDPNQEPAIMLSADYNKVDVTNLDFLLSPTTNPYFNTTGDNNKQPMVTIKIGAKYSSTQAFEQVTHYLQTTVSSRVYKR